MFRAIKIDPNDGLTLLDGTNLEEKDVKYKNKHDYYTSL